mgnify:CR=1 FL=1
MKNLTRFRKQGTVDYISAVLPLKYGVDSLNSGNEYLIFDDHNNNEEYTNASDLLNTPLGSIDMRYLPGPIRQLYVQYLEKDKIRNLNLIRDTLTQNSLLPNIFSGNNNTLQHCSRLYEVPRRIFASSIFLALAEASSKIFKYSIYCSFLFRTIKYFYMTISD